MATQIFDGRQVREVELLDVFPPNEGEISQYYGRIGQGKTYSATADILDLLRRGNVVYANWRIHWTGFDERLSIPYVIISILFPWRKRFFTFKKENLRYLPVDEYFHDTFEKLTDCYVFLDEGHVVFDSYEMAKMSLAKRASILHTRHFNRSICIISQRPTAIHVAMRANVNRFYKCEKRWQFGSLIRFRRTEFQDMLNETVDDDEEKAVSIKQYWGRSEVFNAYPSKYLRGETQASQKIAVEAHDFGYFARFALLYRAMFGHKVKLSTAYPQTIPLTPPESSIQEVKAAVQSNGEQKQTDVSKLSFSLRGETRDTPQESASKKTGEVGKKKQRDILNVKKIYVQHHGETVEKNKKNVDEQNGSLVSRSAIVAKNIVKEAAEVMIEKVHAAHNNKSTRKKTAPILGAGRNDDAGKMSPMQKGGASVVVNAAKVLSVLFLLSFFGGVAYADFAGVETFETYGVDEQLAGKNGGSGWSAAWTAYPDAIITSTTTISATSTRALYLGTCSFTNCERTFTAQTVGNANIWIRKNGNGTTDGGITMYDGVNGKFFLSLRSNGNIAVYNNSTAAYENVTPYNANTWYQLSVMWDSTAQPNKYKGCVRTAAQNIPICSAWVTANGGSYTSIGKFGLQGINSANTIIWHDDVSFGTTTITETPMPTSTPTTTPAAGNYDGTNFQEQLFILCTILFFLSLGTWGKIWQRV